MLKKRSHATLDEVVRRHADGHYIEQTIPNPDSERDKTISDAIAKIKKAQRAKTHQ